MWNEPRTTRLASTVYAIPMVIKCLERLGYEITGTGRKVYLMSFHKENNDFEEFMIPKGESMLLYQAVYDILDKVKIHPAMFDFIYDQCRNETN